MKFKRILGVIIATGLIFNSIETSLTNILPGNIELSGLEISINRDKSDLSF